MRGLRGVRKACSQKSWPCTQGLDGCGRLPASSARIGKGFDDRVRAFVTGGTNDLPRCGMTCPFLVSIVSMFFFSQIGMMPLDVCDFGACGS